MDVGLFLVLALGVSLLDHGLVPAGTYRGVLSIVGTFIIVIVITRFRRESLADLGLRRPRRLWTLPLWVFAIFFSTMVVAGVGQVIVSQLVETQIDLSRFAVLHGNFAMLLAALASVWITAAFFEEIIYRGFLLRNLLEIVGDRKILATICAILLHAILFGLLHAYQGVVGMVGTGLVAIVFGVFFIAQKRNLWALILVHGLIDTIGVVNFYLNGVPGAS